MKTRNLLSSLALLAAGSALVLAYRPGAASPAPAAQYGTPADDAEFLAAEAQRDAWMDQVTATRLKAADFGLEPLRAGFHLVRPDDDPYWSPEFEDPGCSGPIYCWYYPQLRYPTITYNAQPFLKGGALVLDTSTLPAMCELSLDRLFSNTFVTLGVQNEPNGTKSVVATFSARSVSALEFMLQPINTSPPLGYLDWFGTPRPSGTGDTTMRAVLVSGDYAYLPFSIQDVVASGPGPVTVVIASQLSVQEAADLITNYSH